MFPNPDGRGGRSVEEKEKDKGEDEKDEGGSLEKGEEGGGRR